MDKDKIPVLKVFGSSQWHDTVTIVGNRIALEKAIEILQAALSNGKGEFEAMETDGEGYNFEVKLFDHDFFSDEWNKLPVHYTDEIAKENDPHRWKHLWEL